MSETTMAKSPDDKPEGFVKFLESLNNNDDRAALAALRRSLSKSPGAAAEAHRYVLPFNPRVREEAAYYLVAGLFARHPAASWRKQEDDKKLTNFGASFARLQSKVKRESIEKRFVALLDSHEDDLSEHLRHAVSLLRSEDIPVDWVRLLKDLCHWNHEDRFVQRRWARAFWGGNQTDDEQQP
jgi:CRISPR system Cascade subunit CasB